MYEILIENETKNSNELILQKIITNEKDWKNGYVDAYRLIDEEEIDSFLIGYKTKIIQMEDNGEHIRSIPVEWKNNPLEWHFEEIQSLYPEFDEIINDSYQTDEEKMYDFIQNIRRNKTLSVFYDDLKNLCISYYSKSSDKFRYLLNPDVKNIILCTLLRTIKTTTPSFIYIDPKIGNDLINRKPFIQKLKKMGYKEGNIFLDGTYINF